MLIKNLLYILQSEDYEIGRFIKYAYSHLKWWGLQKRQKLVWTKKSIVIYILSVFLFFIILLLAFYQSVLKGALVLIIELFLLPFIILISLLLLAPLNFYLKQRITNKAKSILADAKVAVIGITGSYGKTSTKEILSKILEEKFSVIKTPENVNTDIGISSFIINSKDSIKNTDILIVEMGAYRKGDIKKICDIVKPKYSILTGINESHLEKFGNTKNTIATKFELPENTKIFSVLNISDKNIKDSYKKFIINNPIFSDEDSIKEINFKKDFSGIEFCINNDKFKTKLLARHNLILIQMCTVIAKALGVEIEKIQAGVESILPVKHRLEPMYNNNSNVWVIDDSYNGNIDGIIGGLDVLSRAGGRKIVLTPGLVEQGQKTKEIHSLIGEHYSKKTDLVLLINNDVTKYITESMEKNNFSNFKIYQTTEEAHNDLVNILKSGDTIIFQNDWPDKYF